MTLFKYCREVFANHGIKVQFPRHTDPRHTYKWRYLKKFHDKIDGLNIKDESIKTIIDAIAKNAKEKGQRIRGLSVLCDSDVLERGYEALKEKENSIDNILEVARNDVQVLKDYNADKLSKSKGGGLAKISELYMQNKISAISLAFSKKCRDALLRIGDTSRALIPTSKELQILNLKYLKDKRIRRGLMVIYGSDFYK